MVYPQGLTLQLQHLMDRFVTVVFLFVTSAGEFIGIIDIGKLDTLVFIICNSHHELHKCYVCYGGGHSFSDLMKIACKSNA